MPTPMICNSPLIWPVTWKRYNGMYVSRFERHSIDKVQRSLSDECRRLGVDKAVLTANVKLQKSYAWFIGNQSQPVDRGVALYFEIDGKERVLACDRWSTVESNIWAIARHIDAVRAQGRYHVGSIDQAFAGYTALPAPGQTDACAWWRVLEVGHNAPFEAVRNAYVEKAKKLHPDNGGTHDQMVALNAAWDMARKQYGK